MNHKKKIHTENLSPLPGTANQYCSQQLCSLFIKIEHTMMKLLDKVMSFYQSVFSFIKPSFTLSALSMLLNINGNKVNCWVEKGLTQVKRKHLVEICHFWQAIIYFFLVICTDRFQTSLLSLPQILIIFIWDVVGS